MYYALGYWRCRGEIDFIATNFSLVVCLYEEFVITLLIFEKVDWNLNYVYDIELGYCFSLLVVIACSSDGFSGLCSRI